MKTYTPDTQRYERTPYQRCGRSGLKLPRIALGLWQNFGGSELLDTQRAMLRRAFDLGITHFDAANNYGPPPGSAEENLGRALREDFAAHRDELVISTKAGYPMWPGPYGEWGSRKSLLASLDQSLERLGLDYVDIFYHHLYDPETPLEESMSALADAVRSGRALYVGISNYDAEQTRRAAAMLAELGVKLLIHQPFYNLLDRWVEPELLPALTELGVGCIPYSPLAHGVLTNRYLADIPADSRAAKSGEFLKANPIAPEVLDTVRDLNEVAQARGATLAQLAVLWLLRRPEVTSVLIGASRVSQIDDIQACLSQRALSAQELTAIETILARRRSEDAPWKG
jgi:L-glyceraldehyde 3-phosphate reductase